jgi:formiminotetrahydrofolate cyclodeaminase
VTWESVDDFLEQLASRVPAPGGGSAAALTGAASAGLVGMVCRVTAEHAADGESFRAMAREADELRNRLQALMRDDARAFSSLLEARRVPGDQRGVGAREALCRATEVPLEIAQDG